MNAPDATWIQQREQSSKTVQQVAELAAQRLLYLFRETHLDWHSDYVPLDELVTWLGLNVEPFNADTREAGTYGYVDPEEDGHLIWLRRDLLTPIRRFTLAHELGHVVLHCKLTPQLETLLHDMLPLLKMTRNEQTPPLSDKDACQQDDVEDDSTENEERLQDRLGIGQSYDPRSLREQAANIFAAELLMPLVRVRTLYLDVNVNPATLSDHFGVSSSALLNRLANLLQPATPELVEVTTAQETTASTGEKAHKSYDTFQQTAIEAPTPALIVAGPGSGKTSTLIGRVDYLVEKLSIPPQNILALTFSRKATQEMQERLQMVLDGRDSSRHYMGSDESFPGVGNDSSLPDNAIPKVCTFHAFCADLLRQHGKLVGLRDDFALLDEAESYLLLQRQSDALKLHHYQRLQSPTAYFPDLLKAISRAKDELVSPERYALLAQRMLEQAGTDDEKLEKAGRAAEVAHVYALYQQALAQRGDTDFGGLLMLTLQLFAEHPSILEQQQRQFQHILVDEFQDVNRASGVLLRELAGEARRVWVVGDTNQAIYRFRGASPANMSRFTHDFPDAVILPLSRNYRSRSDLVKIAESFRCKQLEFGEEPGKNEATRLTHDETVVTIAHAKDEASELEGIAHDIAARHANGYAYRDMVVLCRTRAQAQKISRVLLSMNVPIAEHSGLLEQDYIKDALNPLLLLTDASGSGLLRLDEAYTLSQDTLETLLIEAHKKRIPLMSLLYNGEAPLNISIEGRHSLLRLSALLERLSSSSHNLSIWSLLAHYLFIETTTIRKLLYEGQDKTRLGDYDALLQLARHYDAQFERTLASTLQPTHGEYINGFLEYLRLLLLLRQEGTMRRGEQDEDGQLSSDTLRIMTVHASKGLEFPIVYMPGLTKQRFPSTARANPVPPPAGMTQQTSEETEDDEIETEKQAHESGEACLFYVGVTRARDVLVLSYSDRYGKKNYTPSPYLDALRAGLPDERVTRLQWNFDTTLSLTDEDDETINVDSKKQSITERLSSGFLHAMSPSMLRATDIEAYHRCPRQYAYNRLYRFDTDKSGYQLFHRVTQSAIEELHRQSITTTGEEVDVQELYARHWQESGGDALPFALLYEQHGQQVLNTAQRALQAKTHEETLHPQYEVEIAGHIVQVTIDRVEIPDPQASQSIQTASVTTTTQAKKQKQQPSPTSTAFKRTRFGKSKEKADAEMRDLFYALAYRKQYPSESVNLQHHNLSTGEAIPVSMTPKKEQRFQAEAEQAIHGLEKHEYPAKPAESSECLTCPFSFICPM